MSNEKWNDPARSLINPRYIVLSLVTTLCVVAGVAGLLSERLGLGDILGQYGEMLHDNWINFIAVGVGIGLFNLVLTVRSRTRS